MIKFVLYISIIIMIIIKIDFMYLAKLSKVVCMIKEIFKIIIIVSLKKFYSYFSYYLRIFWKDHVKSKRKLNDNKFFKEDIIFIKNKALKKLKI